MARSRNSPVSPTAQLRCPHCDSVRVVRMADRPYEAISTNTWFQCEDCQRMWSQPKTDAHRATSEQQSI